jgi:hypothetical protein
VTPPFPPVSLPPATAHYENILQPSKPGAAPQQTTSSLFRSADGKTRVDSGNTSVITDPASGKTVLLDHVAKQARVIPTPPPAPPKPGVPAPPSIPGMPGAPAAPSTPSVSVMDLGKKMMNGHEVQGQHFTYPSAPTPGTPSAAGAPSAPGAPSTPGAPAAPGMPAVPKLPSVPGMPSAPKSPSTLGAPSAPGAPTPPGMPSPPAIPSAPTLPASPSPAFPPHTAEVWTTTKTHLPMLTKMTGPHAQLTSSCKSLVPGEPHPSTFQIPPGYKLVP